MDLQFNTTNRAFGRIEFTDLYDVKCSVQASSLATEEAIWIGANEIGLKHFKAFKGWMDVPTPHSVEDHWNANTRMHLSREQVAALLPILTHFVETGDLPRSV